MPLSRPPSRRHLLGRGVETSASPRAPATGPLHLQPRLHRGERVRDQVRRLLVQGHDPAPLVWLQPGAEDELAIAWLQEAGWAVVHDDCVVRYAQRHGLSRPAAPQPWFRQVADEDASGCSVWTVHEAGEQATAPTTSLEWVGDLSDLEHSTHTVPSYIRRLRAEGEGLEDCARRLAQ